jgi:uncharacterized protein (DUF1800 family)
MARTLLAVSTVLVLSVLHAGGARAQTPPEVQNVDFSDTATLSWGAAAGADHYNVYRGDLAVLASGVPGRCHGHAVMGTTFATPADPGPNAGYFFLVTGESNLDGEGTPGAPSAGGERPLLGSCGPVMRTHVLDRIGYGWDEWSRDRIDALGLQGHIDEQLDPASIDEATNTDLTTRLAPYDPPETIFELIGRQVVMGTYARRQLEQQYTTFWTNHFNTFWAKVQNLFQVLYPDCDGGLPQCDPNFPQIANLQASLAQHHELEDFRNLGFNGSFREIVEASALSRAMILYLDLYASNAATPNENFPRELLELYTMGVEGGYTQQDVEEVSRALTGWTICKRKTPLVGQPQAPCIDLYYIEPPEGEWDARFVPDNHDCTEKILFETTPYEAVIPDTCSTPTDGENDMYLVLDALVAHPATARYISTKILQRFVTDMPTEEMIDALVLEWDDAGNPNGVGDLREVLRAALSLGAFLDPDMTGSKVKTPAEHFISALRAIRGTTDGVTIIVNYLVNAQHIPHYNEVPTGWPETGDNWIGTNNTLERQNYGVHVSAFSDLAFGSDPIGLLNDNGVSTAPGNAAAIIDFYADVLFGGALTPAERQAAIDFLETDNLGNPTDYDDTRIRRTVGLMLGYGQFQEQ